MRATETVEVLVRQAFVVAGILVGSVIALSEGAPWARWLSISAALVLFGLALAAAAFEQAKRDAARDLITDGRERLPIAAVQHQLRRLLARRTRNTLARSLERIVHDAWSPRPPVRASAIPYNRRVVLAVADDLLAVTRLLRTDNASARGVALAHRLLTDGMSPLYGSDVEPLLEELNRARYYLST